MSENFIANPKLKFLKIKNVQSIKDCTLEFTESGVFHIKGANNAGKSAVLRSIQLLMKNYNNLRYKSLLRDDSDTATVELVTQDNSKLKISRGASDYYSWEINGQANRINKTKGKIPVTVEKYLNLYTDNEKTNECVNIRMQRERLLFVDTTPTDNLYLFQKAVGTEEFLLGVKKAETLKKDKTKENKLFTTTKENEVESLTEINKELYEVNQVLDSLESTYNVILNEYDVIQEIQDVLKQGMSLSKAVKEEREFSKQMGCVDLSEIKEAIAELKDIEDCYKKYQAYKKYHNELEELHKKYVPKEDIVTMAELVKDLIQLNKSMRISKDYSNHYKELAKVSNIYNNLIESVNEIGSEIEDLKLIQENIESKKKLDSLLEDVEIAEQDYTLADENLVTFMRENSFCPIVATTKNKKCPFQEGA